MSHDNPQNKQFLKNWYPNRKKIDLNNSSNINQLTYKTARSKHLPYFKTLLETWVNTNT